MATGATPALSESMDRTTAFFLTLFFNPPLKSLFRLSTYSRRFTHPSPFSSTDDHLATKKLREAATGEAAGRNRVTEHPVGALHAPVSAPRLKAAPLLIKSRTNS